MRCLLVAVLALSGAAAHAQTFTCPQVYPGKDRPAAPLTGATMAWGEDRTGIFAGDYTAPAQEGYDATYPILADMQAWLVCSYGGKKRYKGEIRRDGHEWNQRVEWSPTEWWVRLPPKVHDCTVRARENKVAGQSVSTWTVTTSCDQSLSR